MSEFLEVMKHVFRLYLFCCLWNVVFTWKEMRCYDKIYKDLPNRKFYLWKDVNMIISTPIFTNDMIIWRYKRGTFSLKNGVILLNSPFYYLNSPYTLYWYWKFKKWFRENLDLSQLEEFDEINSL